MPENTKILGVITARGGSKGLPGKNIKLLGGKPLIAYTVEAAKQSRLVTHLIVSTDDPEIAEVCRKYGAEVPFIRPAELAQDGTPHLPVMQHAIEFMEKKLGISFEYTVIFQPTSPFRLPEHIDGTLEKLIASHADSAVSLVEADSGSHPMKIKKLEGDRVHAYVMEEPEGTRRQDLPKAYKRSAAVYAMRRDLIMNDNRLYGDYVVGHVVPKEFYVDIDTALDFMQAEYMLGELQKKGYHFGTMPNAQKAKSVYAYFKSRPGSEHIATPVSLEALLDLIEKEKPKRVLEVGAGVGTLTYALLKYTDVSVDAYEDHPFCIDTLKQNLIGFESRYRLIEDYHMLPPQKTYDLVIIDGPTENKEKGITKEGVVTSFLNHLDSLTFLYIEGHRFNQRLAALEALKNRFRLSAVRYGARLVDGEKFKGGFELHARPLENPGVDRAKNARVIAREKIFQCIHLWRKGFSKFSSRLLYRAKKARSMLLRRSYSR